MGHGGSPAVFCLTCPAAGRHGRAADVRGPPNARSPMTERSPARPPFIVVRDDVTRSMPADDALNGAVAAIGNFEGVHRGHRAVIATALERARQLGRNAA